MGRAKIPMEPIANPKKRKSTFNARNNGMIKKARELATLCDVNVSIIIFTDDQQTPQIFPPDHDELVSSIDVYNRTRHVNPESIKRYALSDYYADRKMKVQEELVKEKKKNLESKFPSWVGFLDDFSEAGLREFALGLENKILDVQSRLERFKNIQNVGLGLYNSNNQQMMMMQSWNPSLMDPIMMPSGSMMNMQMLNEDFDDNHVIMMPASDSMMLNEDDDDGYNFNLEPPVMLLNEDFDDGEDLGTLDPLMEEQYCFPHHHSLMEHFFMSGF